MTIDIQNLNCRIRIRSSKRPLLHPREQAVLPAMPFTLAKPLARTENAPEPAEMATEERNAAAGGKPPLPVGNIDPTQVAERVYELMQREIVLTRERGGPARKG